jgi:chromosome segregation ATPase
VTPEPKQSYEDETTRTVEHLHQRLSEAEDALLVMKWQSQQQASDREALTQAFNQVSDEKVQLQDQHKTLTLSLQDATAAVYEKDEAIALLQESLEASDAARHELSEEVTQQAKTITELREKLQAQISEFEGVQERSSKQDRTEVVQLQAEIHDLRRKMAHQTGEIEGLRDMVTPFPDFM